jgi:hypothetical protein
VLLDDHGLDDGGRDEGPQRRLQDLDDPGRERGGEPVAGDLRDEAVQSLVDLRDEDGVVGAGVGLGDDRLQLRDLLVRGALRGEPDERDLEQHPRLEQLVDRDGLGLEHARDRRAHGPADALLWCAATKIPPPGPFEARTRCELASSRNASRRVGRLTPNWRARSSSRPRRSPGRSPSACV